MKEIDDFLERRQNQITLRVSHNWLITRFTMEPSREMMEPLNAFKNKSGFELASLHGSPVAYRLATHTSQTGPEIAALLTIIYERMGFRLFLDPEVDPMYISQVHHAIETVRKELP